MSRMVTHDSGRLVKFKTFTIRSGIEQESWNTPLVMTSGEQYFLHAYKNVRLYPELCVTILDVFEQRTDVEHKLCPGKISIGIDNISA